MGGKNQIFLRSLVVVFVYATLNGCMAADPAGPPAGSMTLVESTATERPMWITHPPEDNDTHYFFCGQSSQRNSEKEAQEEAILNARQRCIEFAGVEVRFLQEIESSGEGKSSDILDASLSSLSRISQTATASISQLQIRQWYGEKYSTNTWGIPSPGYRYWVLVAVPKDELLRIQMQRAQRSEVSDAGQETIHLSIKVNAGHGAVFQEGEPISLSVGTDRDCYLLLLYQDAAGHLVQLLPNRHAPEAFFSAGQAFRLPGKHDGFLFTATKPFGKEILWALAASRPFAKLKGLPQPDGSVLLHDTMDHVLNSLRGHGQLPGMLYAEARTVITTVPRTQPDNKSVPNNHKEVQR